MKFGRSLHKHQVLCWASYYLDYNGLKQKIKLLRANFLDSNGASDFREILDDLLRGIDHVEAFYEKAYSAVWNEALSFSSSTSLFEQNKWQFGDVEELRFHLGAFLQLRAALEKLRWYGTVNSQGFKRLFQKLNSFPADQAYATVIDDVTIKLREAQFSCQAKVIHDMGCVQTSITRITETLSRNLFTSRRSLILDHFMQHTCQNLEDSDVIYQAIQNDDARLLEPPIRKYREAAETDKSATERFLLTLIELSIIHESMECLESLLLLLESINGPEVIARNYLPLTVVRIIVKTGQQMMLTDTSSPVLSCDAQVNKFIQRNNGTQLLRRLLTRFSTKMQTLFTRDPVTNHPPIYYAAQYGLLDICQLLLECMQDEKPDNILLCSESILLEDDLGNSPLKVAISCGFKEVTDYLLGFLTRNQCLNSGSWDLVSGDLLAVAINTSSGCAEQLLAAKPDVNYQNGHGETALYTAARSGNVEIANKLLICGANVEIAERNRGWTPLIVASVEGHISVVELLLQAGAVPSKHDHLGWTALDHAAYRGHITLSRKIKQLVSHTTQSLAPSPLVAQPCPTQYATKTGNESVILVNPGSLDTKRKLTFIDLYQTSNGTTAVSQIGLRVEILLLTEHSPKYEVDLPILEDMTNNAWRFYTTNSSSAKLLFKLQRETVTANEARMEDHIGSAVALLDNLKQGLGPSRESLIRDYTIPIYSTASHDSIGTVTFSFLVVKPFAQTKRRLPARNTLWKEGERTKVVGHRGLGQNTLKPGRLSIGENTTQSFLSAMDLGADWVELDIQVTKDLVPVVYHDFPVSETGTDVWVHNLTLEQFMHISNSQSQLRRESIAEHPAQRPRSYSLDSNDDQRPVQLIEQLKNTFEYKQKGFKGNTRGSYIHQPFLTLHDLLSQTPDSVALNIEIKYPMLFEATDDWKLDIIAMEINLFVDTILSTILSHPSCHHRPVMFSSFSPEICILLSLKQDMFPVFFLNDAGNFPTGDIRASSLQEAIRFATSWDLDGIVMASQPFVFAPKLIGVAKRRGLVTASYGVLNDEPECAKIQAAAGLDILIVDAVRLISETLGGIRSRLPN